MSILDRLRRLIASNVNALFESLTDPGAAIDELIGNMEDAARDAREQLKGALIEDKRAIKLQQATEASVAEWSARAERAVAASDDDLAKEALSRRHELQEQVQEIAADREKSSAHLREIERGLRELEAKIRMVKSRKETLKAVVRSRVKGGDAVDRFDRFVTDVDRREAEVELGNELGDMDKNMAAQDISARIDRLERDGDAEVRLQALKEKMKK